MPATSFVLDDSPCWNDSPVWPIPSTNRSTPKPKKKRKPKPPRKPPRRELVIGSGVRSILIDRLEHAITTGRIDLMEDDGETPEVAITTGELGLLLVILLGEEYAAPVRAPALTRTAPGSASRIAEYSRRVENGEVLFAQGDSRADGIGRGLRIVQRANGTGPKIIGWMGDEE